MTPVVKMKENYQILVRVTWKNGASNKIRNEMRSIETDIRETSSLIKCIIKYVTNV